MQVNFMVLCEYATRLHNGAPALMGIVRGIVVSEFPTEIETLFIAMELEAEPHEEGTHELVLRMIDQDGAVFFDEELEVDFVRRPEMLPMYCYFCAPIRPDRPLPTQGVYRFDLMLGVRTLAQARIEVVQAGTDEDD